MSILLGNGDGTFQNPQVYSLTGTYPAFILAADFNHDGKLDLAVANRAGGSGNQGDVDLFMGKGDGTFGSPVEISTNGGNYLLSGDFNGDHNQDLAIAGTDVIVLLGNGNGTFQAPMNFAPGISFWAMGLGDFNGDGKVDIVGETLNNTASVLYGNGDGTFGSPVTFNVGNNPHSAAVGDFNLDGAPDVAITLSFQDSVAVLLNRGATSPRGSRPTDRHWLPLPKNLGSTTIVSP
jgi:hypothetical protein